MQKQEDNYAVVLLSGGLDSATTLAIAAHQGFSCYALTVDYGQRHHAELTAAKTIAQALKVVEHKIMRVDLGQIGGSALTDVNLAIPVIPSIGIPITYVPGRNTILLSLAVSWAEVIQAVDIFIGVNAVDYSGYPDCRPAFINSFENVANLGTKAGIEGKQFHIHAPLLQLSKSEIIKLGLSLKLDYSLTVSCYQADNEARACGQCDACRLRAQGFAMAGVADSTRYMQLDIKS